MTFTFTFTCMHLDAFIQSDLQCIQAIIIFCQYVSVDCKLVGQYDGRVPKAVQKAKVQFVCFPRAFQEKLFDFQQNPLGFCLSS